MFSLILLTALVGGVYAGCSLSPTADQTVAHRNSGDGGYRILISGEFDKYIPNAIYSVSLRGSASNDRKFTRFSLSLDSQSAPFNPAARVGFFQIFPESLAQFSEECVNTVSEISAFHKSEIEVMWRAPPRGSGCVIFTAMVMENPNLWFAEDANLSKTFCEMSLEETEKLDELSCCACDEAKYKMSLEGMWSNATHPKDFPSQVWLTHFSDVIGASHETNFSFWGRDQIATDGFRQLAEWGSSNALEAELHLKEKHIRTLIKAAGLWYPNVNTNTSATFRVDKFHPLLSIASMLAPSPDWFIGVNKLNLCQKDCTWVRGMKVDLYPWDAGTDNGISYLSQNSETRPREKMRRITPMYPEDPRAPFYDPTEKPMLPVAVLYVERESVNHKSCDDHSYNRQIAEFQDTANPADTRRVECQTTEYSQWTPCSVSCGTGFQTRTRAYKIPERAELVGCNEELNSTRNCHESECPSRRDNLAITNIHSINCQTDYWTQWSQCSVSCGKGVRVRSRNLQIPANFERCNHVSLMETTYCFLPECLPRPHLDGTSECEVNEWSQWSACSVSCGHGVMVRTRRLQTDFSHCNRIQLTQRRVCMVQANCPEESSYRTSDFCNDEPERGTCTGNYQRWAFDPAKHSCVSFSYGGCRGNRNNFETMEECRRVCDKVTINERPSPLIRAQVPTDNDRGMLLQKTDCLMSTWSLWSECSVPCGSGHISSYRTILRNSANGGRPCPQQLVRRAQCYLGPCPSGPSVFKFDENIV